MPDPPHGGSSRDVPVPGDLLSAIDLDEAEHEALARAIRGVVMPKPPEAVVLRRLRAQAQASQACGTT